MPLSWSCDPLRGGLVYKIQQGFAHAHPRSFIENCAAKVQNTKEKKYADKVGCQQLQQPKSFVSELNGLRCCTVASFHRPTLFRFRSAH